MLENKEIYGVIVTSIRAGLETLKYYNSSDVEVQFKSDSSPLTLADLASHKIIDEALTNVSVYPVLSEESVDVPFSTRSGWSNFWLVDPLDGTKEFIKKNGEFTVNIALVISGEVAFGVVYAPVLDILYVGGFGVALKLNDASKLIESYDDLDKLIDRGERLSVCNEVHNTLKVVASKSHCNQETVDFIDNFRQRYSKVENVSCGSSLKLCMVADGSANIYPRLGPTMEWDTAAAHAVVNAAGGTVVDYSTGVELKYNKESLLNPFFVVKDKVTCY